MKSLPVSAAIALLPTALACAGVLPEPFPASRYEKMLADSPFALATAVAPPEKTEPSWIANLYLGPVWRVMRDGVEHDYAVVRSRSDVSGSFTLTDHEEGPDGIQLVSLHWDDDITKTEAMVKKGTDIQPLKPDQMAGVTAPPPQQPQVRPGQPQPRANGQQLGVPNPINGINTVRRPAQPNIPQPIVPRPSVPAANQPAAANQFNNNQIKPNPTDRQRIRQIPSPVK